MAKKPSTTAPTPAEPSLGNEKAPAQGGVPKTGFDDEGAMRLGCRGEMGPGSGVPANQNKIR